MGELAPERTFELHLAVTEVLTPPLVAAVANHLETHTPVVLEGDYIFPTLIERCVAQFGYEYIVGAFLVEEEDQLGAKLHQP